MGSILDVFSLISGGGASMNSVAYFPTFPIVEAEDFDW
jgi:hypothetical protein